MSPPWRPTRRGDDRRRQIDLPLACLVVRSRDRGHRKLSGKSCSLPRNCCRGRSFRPYLEQFRNYCGLIKIARSGFPWEKTTKRPIASVYTNCGTALIHREARIPLQQRGLYPGRFTTLPKLCPASHTIPERSSIRIGAAFERTGNTDELRIECIAGRAHDRVAMAAHVDELQMGREFRIRGGVACLARSPLR